MLELSGGVRSLPRVRGGTPAGECVPLDARRSRMLRCRTRMVRRAGLKTCHALAGVPLPFIFLGWASQSEAHEVWRRRWARRVAPLPTLRNAPSPTVIDPVFHARICLTKVGVGRRSWLSCRNTRGAGKKAQRENEKLFPCRIASMQCRYRPGWGRWRREKSAGQDTA